MRDTKKGFKSPNSHLLYEDFMKLESANCGVRVGTDRLFFNNFVWECFDRVGVSQFFQNNTKFEAELQESHNFIVIHTKTCPKFAKT